MAETNNDVAGIGEGGGEEQQQPPQETFSLFADLSDEPYGMLPLSNLSSKGGPTMMKQYERIASYNWFLDDSTTPTIVVPGFPRELKFWGGGLLQHDRGVLIYDVNHLKMPKGPMDPVFLVTKMFEESMDRPMPDYQEFDLVTDSINLQKLFAFCSGGSEGLFRIDFERIGKMVVASRRESSDLMTFDYESYDHILKHHLTKPRSKMATGPYHQMAKCQFGDIKLLVRFEADCADYYKLPGAKPPGKKKKKKGEESSDEEEEPPRPDDDENAVEMAVDAKTKFLKDPTGETNYDLSFIPWGEVKAFHLMSVTAYPQAAGFPFYIWPQLFFSGIDSAQVGWWKGTGDFSKPAAYDIKEVSKLLKPLPLVSLGKVHDCMRKILGFLRQNEEEMRVSIVWKGKDNLEIYFIDPKAPSGISQPVRDMLREQVKEPQPEK